MSGIECNKWIRVKKFEGLPTKEDLQIVKEELPELKDGEFMCEALWLSVDPYMRPYSDAFPVGTPMIGEQVARVIQSKNDKYSVGDVVTAMFGWASHFICNDAIAPKTRLVKVDTSIVPEDKLSLALGILGMPGATAYFGFLELCQPKAGETLVVNSAAGAVGSLVGQIAKIKGCRVVGYAGSDAKVEYMKSLGFDAAYNYKTMSSLKDTLKESCPNGVDMFFDNVGGEFFTTVIQKMNNFGRVSLCGAISQYNVAIEERPKVPPITGNLLSKQIKVEGFLVTRWGKEWGKAFKELKGWIDEGKLKYNEHVSEGFENMFDAFMGLFRGDNIGKAVVKV